MTFKNEISISDIISVASVFLVIVGGLFALFQWRRNVALKRANYINDLTEKIRTDPYIRDVIYMLDYDETWYSEQFHGSGDLELKIDKTLSHFSYICYLKKQKLLSEKEFTFFEYEIKRILGNQQVQNYLYNLYHFSKKMGSSFTFQYLFDYGVKQKLFEESFYDERAHMTSDRYHRYLNF